MGEKFATIEKLVGDDKSVAFTFFDRYLRSKTADSIKPLPATSTTLGGEDDCETLSGSEKWGTPTSGGESELQSPVSNEFSDEMEDVNPLEVFLAATHITTVNVRFPPTAIKSRLEPLPEDEEESYYSDNSSSNTNSKCLTLDEIYNDSSSTHISRSLIPLNHSSQSGFFNRLLLRRSKSVETSPSKDSTKLTKFFSRAKSEDNNSSSKHNHNNSKHWSSKESYSSSFDSQNNRQAEKSFWNHLTKKDKNSKKLK
ncbi:hypothetical protein M8J76_015351 [Diaphorina citri]|nr:hypothetical protein M8J75_012353 [Diaphorina citri]KAI5727173.1 hypothetical protein M8J76_015351 [Diaphorina citri]KAI5730845.1 hypothetical protein M8J77_000711 [Diaphorina citri]